MKSILLVFILLAGVAIATFPVTIVRAQNGGLSSDIKDQLGAAGVKSGLGNTDPRLVVAKVIMAVLGLLGTIFLGLTVYAGYLYMTAQGEEEPVTKAKGIIRNSIIGLGVILMAYGITIFVFNSLVYANYKTTKNTGWLGYLFMKGDGPGPGQGPGGQ